MPKDTYPVQYGKLTWRALVQLEKFGYEMPEVFTDFVDFVLSALLSWTDNMKYTDTIERFSENALTGLYNDRYMQIIAKYKENKSRPYGQRPCDYMRWAWQQLQIETQQTQKDVLGHLYESQISLGRQGQFFTPHHLYRMMAEMLSNTTPGEAQKEERVHDPACGSGRAFIVMAQQNLDQKYHFVGIDISPLMARMAAINMWLFNLNADIYQGNTLASLEMSCVWKIRKGGWIWESKIEHGTEDGSVEEWLAEYTKNHPPLSEEERQALREDYERHLKILSVIREMEAQLARFRVEGEAALSEESMPVERQDEVQVTEGEEPLTLPAPEIQSSAHPLYQEIVADDELTDVHQGDSEEQPTAKKYTTRSVKKRLAKERKTQKPAERTLFDI